MTKTLPTIIFLCVSIAVVFSTKNAAHTKSSGSPLASTGSPADGTNNTCAKAGCHFGTVNSFSGSVSIDVSDIPASGYIPGSTYSIKVNVAEASRSTYGFQLTAEDNSGSKMGTYTENTSVKKVSQNWVTHKFNSSSGNWTVDWTAPSGAGDITFYAAGNAANGNNTSSGDHIYTTSVTVSKSAFASVGDIEKDQTEKIYAIGGQNLLVVETAVPTEISVYGLGGQLERTMRMGSGKSEIQLNDLAPSTYIIHSSVTGQTKRIILY